MERQKKSFHRFLLCFDHQNSLQNNNSAISHTKYNTDSQAEIRRKLGVQGAWQQIGGYNDLYDYVFDVGTSMNKEKFPFTHNSNEYVMWAWKGDYVNLGAGAELGVYSNQSGFFGVFNFSSPFEDHYLVDTSLSMPMTLKLEDYNGNLISDYSANHWWVTSFNPAYKDVDANNLSATYTVDFSSNQDMYDSFSNEWYGQDKRLLFDKDNYSVNFEFK